MHDCWFKHVVVEINKCNDKKDRLLEITSQIVHMEEIELIPVPVADRLMDEIANVNKLNK